MASVEQEARQKLQAGQPQAAETLLRKQLALTPRNVALRAMLAQVLSSLGRKDEAIGELTKVVDEAPDARAPRLLLARLANELGNVALAEGHAKFLTAANPGDSEAWSAFGFAAFALGRRNTAREALKRAVALSPGYAAAHFNLASVLCDQESSEDALAEAEEAARLGARPRGTHMVKARALIQLDRLEEAEQLLGKLLADNPGDSEAQSILVRLRQVRGDEDPLRDLRKSAQVSGASPALRLALGDALRRSGDLPGAEAELRRLVAEFGNAPQLLTSIAAVLQEAGRMDEAHRYSSEALAAMPDNPGIAENFVVSAIATGKAAEALPVVERYRASHPRDQRWVTYRIDIARLRAEEAFASWFDPRVVTRTFDLPAPAGFRDVAEFHQALTAVLVARHRHKNHPLDQSLRHGTQTSRNLLVRPEPVVAQLLASFSEAIAQFQRDMGVDPAHPLFARNTSPAKLIGCWSVRLRLGGFHVNHIHPEGWLSSAYYVSVPDEVSDETARAGWLKFGEPRFPVAGLGPLGFVQPAPGRLVLFPSYLWHGTNALHRDTVRMSVAFDALPGTDIQ